MARRALGPAGMAVLEAVRSVHAGEPVLVACSGGADSLALALAVRYLSARQGFPARAVVVDHGLQVGSAGHSREVAAQLETIGLPARVAAVTVQALGQGPEGSAREARYAALAGALAPGERCYLGHTLDDQAETVLLGLARGSGGRSLAGMPAVRDVYVRPLLGLEREVTRQSCREQAVDWWDDPHNADPRFLRVRVRNSVMPVLENELGPGIARALARTADLVREDSDALDALAAAPAQAELLDCAALAGMPAGLRNHVLRRWLLDRGAAEVTRRQVLAVAGLVTGWHGQKWVELPRLRVSRTAGRLSAVQQPAP